MQGYSRHRHRRGGCRQFDQPGGTEGSEFVEKVTALVEDLKAKADSFDKTPTPAINHNISRKAGAFCETVERDLNIAIENSLANQQQLYVTGAAVLAEGAQLVLAANGTPTQ